MTAQQIEHARKQALEKLSNLIDGDRPGWANHEEMTYAIEVEKVKAMYVLAAAIGQANATLEKIGNVETVFFGETAS